MVKATKFGMATAAIGALFLAGCGSGGSGDVGNGGGGEVTLHYSSMLTEDSSGSQLFSVWMDEVTEQSDGAIQFETYYDGSLCTQADALSCGESGTADIIFDSPIFHPEMVATNVPAIGFQTADVDAQARTAATLAEEFPEFNQPYEDRNLKVLFTIANAPPVLAMKDPIDSIDDLNGLSIRATGNPGVGLGLLGANPVAIEAHEVYESVERGVVAGLAYGFDQVLDTQLYEVAPNIYDLSEIGVYATQNWSINQDSFDALSPEQQEITASVSETISLERGTEFVKAKVDEFCETMDSNDVTVGNLTPEDAVADWEEEGLEVVKSDWLEQADQAGLSDPEALLARSSELLEENTADDAQTIYEACGS